MLLGVCNIHPMMSLGACNIHPTDVAGCRSDGTSVLQQEAAPLWSGDSIVTINVCNDNNGI